MSLGGINPFSQLFVYILQNKVMPFKRLKTRNLKKFKLEVENGWKYTFFGHNFSPNKAILVDLECSTNAILKIFLS